MEVRDLDAIDANLEMAKAEIQGYDIGAARQRVAVDLDAFAADPTHVLADETVAIMGDKKNGERTLTGKWGDFSQSKDRVRTIREVEVEGLLGIGENETGQSSLGAAGGQQGLLFGNPTKVRGPMGNPQLIAKAEKVVTAAKPAKKFIDDEVTAMAAEIPGVRLAGAPIKKVDRIVEKVEKELAGDFSQLQDVARNTVVPFTESSRAAVIDRMDKRKDVTRKKVQSPGSFMGYQGVIYNVRTPSGMIAEIQVVSPRMIYGKNSVDNAKKILGDDVFNQIQSDTDLEPGLGHGFYEQLRSMTIEEREGEAGVDLENKSFAYYSNLR